MSQYIHHVPGRIRVRSKAFRCQNDKALLARSQLLALEGVRNVEINTRAASILVQYDPERLSRPELFAALEEVGCIDAVRHDRASSPTAKIGETFGKTLVGVVVQKAVEQSARSLVGAFI
ncbi:heavy-metal-associated domain-containing protein [Thiohalocapsa marina]|uniref:Heavy-metal-associated domain-containing protein n=1 Tax=Thiohalocapsa marina TaxID=424902 RepID=A0A5M8FRV3_9GAMM|nr:heavy-metal-associated domain-containing protein [Thiohalocapsa marina]KAA6185805.1 heavy-metal-associated domain-containing protein [Thiohalocapsa marina]